MRRKALACTMQIAFMSLVKHLQNKRNEDIQKTKAELRYLSHLSHSLFKGFAIIKQRKASQLLSVNKRKERLMKKSFKAFTVLK